jgi:hypothetical protein
MKTEYTIMVESDQRLGNETQMEILANIRNAMRTVDNSYPEMRFTVLKKVTVEDIAEELGSSETEDDTREHCYYYDEAQGRHKCLNKLVKSKKCEGVCKYYWNKKNLTG